VAGQFLSRAYVVLLRKSIPQRTTYKLPLCLALCRNMRMSKVLLFIFLTFSATGAIACSCISKDPSLKASIRSHTSLAQVKTLSREKVVTGRGEYYKTKVSIVKFWKGNANLQEYFLLTETEESSSCGGPAPVLGEEFLVFAWAQDEGFLYSGGCSSYSPVSLESTKSQIKQINKYFNKAA
jgi:hypothetical protein